MATLDQRLISGRGLLRLPITSTDYKKAKIITLYCDVIRRPRSEYKNFAYNPPRSRYATLVFMRDGYVVREEAIEFPKQSFEFYPEPAAQTLYAVECAYQGTLESIRNLGVSLGSLPISFVNNIEDWNHVDLFWDEVKVVCFADTAVLLTAESKPYDLCPEQTDKEPTPPPPPPDDDSLDVVPPGQPLGQDGYPDVSDAYDGDTDDGDSVPFPDDVPVDTTPPRTCTVRNVTFNWDLRGDPGNVRGATFAIFGDVGGIRNGDLGDGTYAIQLYCYGVNVPGEVCREVIGWYAVVSPTGEPNYFSNPRIVSIVPPQ